MKYSKKIGKRMVIVFIVLKIKKNIIIQEKLILMNQENENTKRKKSKKISNVLIWYVNL